MSIYVCYVNDKDIRVILEKFRVIFEKEKNGDYVSNYTQFLNYMNKNIQLNL